MSIARSFHMDISFSDPPFNRLGGADEFGSFDLLFLPAMYSVADFLEGWGCSLAGNAAIVSYFGVVVPA